MQSIYGYFNGENFIPVGKATPKKNQKVIITILDDFIDNEPEKPYKKYVGKLDNENRKEITEILKDCEKVDYNEW